MTETENRIYLIDYLLKEKGEQFAIPRDEYSQRRLLRSLLNVRPPVQADGEFLHIQDEYLKQQLNHKKITEISQLTPIAPIYTLSNAISQL